MIPETDWVFTILELANRILSAAILITAFSMGIYILKHNFRSAVGRAFCILLTLVMVVYLGDVTILETVAAPSASIWLRFQWVGIAFMPAGYLHFSDALLNATSSVSKWRRLAVQLSYLGGGLTLLLVILTHWVVQDGIEGSPAPRLQAGPLFWVFTLYFFATVLSGAINVNRARVRCLTAASRRRMAYLTVSFAAPALGVFPYMLLSTLPASLPEPVLMTILLLGNVGVAFMIVMMTYAVAYFGAFNPDRVIKYGLIEYIIRGPLLASLVLVVLLTVPQIETFLGLSGDIITLFVTALTIILVQSGISLARPYLNRLVYRQDLEEITWLQELDTRLLTPSDLEQFLENVLSSLSELLRVRHAFVIVVEEQGFEIKAYCGDRKVVSAFLEEYDLEQVGQQTTGNGEISPGFVEIDGYILRSLCTQGQDAVLGYLIVERWPLAPQVSEELQNDVFDLIAQAEVALEDSQLQQGIFVALQQIMPDIERIQKRRQLMRYVTLLPRPLNDSLVNDPAFSRWVKDAMSHYWGGPKLTQSPLLNLGMVVEMREQLDGDGVRALRAVLQQAIDALRPAGEQNLTATEWTLYNILDLKFRQGYRMTEIARRLAISESDLYRKQRTAITEVARILAQMELGQGTVS
jgi:hypothetical protein